MKVASAVGLLAFAATVTFAGPAVAAPSSVQRDGGPCYPHEIGTDSADGTLYCSGLEGTWQNRAVHRAAKVRLGTPCTKLGDQAIVFASEQRATCRDSGGSLTWQP